MRPTRFFLLFNCQTPAAQISLTADEMTELETMAANAGVDTRGSWEHPMV